MKQAARSKTERRYIPEDRAVHSHLCENLTSASEMGPLRSVFGVALRDKMRSENIREHLETGNIVEEIKQYQRISKEHAERMACELLPRKEYCYSKVKVKLSL
jgi:hypothetical protein